MVVVSLPKKGVIEWPNRVIFCVHESAVVFFGNFPTRIRLAPNEMSFAFPKVWKKSHAKKRESNSETWPQSSSGLTLNSMVLSRHNSSKD